MKLSQRRFADLLRRVGVHPAKCTARPTNPIKIASLAADESVIQRKSSSEAKSYATPCLRFATRVLLWAR
jgi:hypothetical protein